MPRLDYYEILGVPRDATDSELKRAFRALAHRYHPDKNPGDRSAEERFKEINEAYAVLSDGDKRAAYDRYGHAAFAPGGAPAAGFAGSVSEVLDSLFGDLFRKKVKKARGRDLRYTLEVSFEEAALGTSRSIRFPTRKDCPGCDGHGALGAGLTVCDKCGGRGEVRVQQGLFTLGRMCTGCGGAGRVVVDPCQRCQGSGLVEIEREFTVKIPAGSEDGSVRMVAGEGEPGRRGGAPGDLHVIVRVKEHPFFSREGYDVVCEVPVSFPQASLGAQVEVPTLEGKVTMRVPAGTQSGAVFRLRQKGIPRPDGRGRGDQRVKVVVETPTHLSERQKELLRAFADESGDAVSPRTKGFLDRLRELFGE